MREDSWKKIDRLQPLDDAPGWQTVSRFEGSEIVVYGRRFPLHDGAHYTPPKKRWEVRKEEGVHALIEVEDTKTGLRHFIKPDGSSHGLYWDGSDLPSQVRMALRRAKGMRLGLGPKLTLYINFNHPAELWDFLFVGPEVVMRIAFDGSMIQEFERACQRLVQDPDKGDGWVPGYGQKSLYLVPRESSGVLPQLALALKGQGLNEWRRFETYLASIKYLGTLLSTMRKPETSPIPGVPGLVTVNLQDFVTASIQPSGEGHFAISFDLAGLGKRVVVATLEGLGNLERACRNYLETRLSENVDLGDGAEVQLARPDEGIGCEVGIPEGENEVRTFVARLDGVAAFADAVHHMAWRKTQA